MDVEELKNLVRLMVGVEVRTLVAGIDLAGNPKNPTGICLLEDRKIVDCRELYDDEEIIAYCLEAKANLAAIDAPLSLPPGRESIEDENGQHLRECDRRLTQLGIKFFPITLGPMRQLTKRGMLLKAALENEGVRAIEMYPGASQDIWQIPRKQKGLEKLRAGLENLGIEGLREDMSDHELDAISGAYTGYLFLMGRADILGSFEEGAIIVPRPPTI